MTKVHDRPSKVAADQGIVVVDGPDGVAVSLTPRAAEATSDRLLQGAIEAQGQRVQAGMEQPEGPMEDEPDDLSPQTMDAAASGDSPDNLADGQT